MVSEAFAKRADSFYEPGKRSGAWNKYRLNLGQEFVVRGVRGNPFDALIVGFYRGKDLMFAARVRAGFVPATRREVFAKLKGLKISKCPFVNLPEAAPGRWGQGLTAEKMKSCLWVNPVVVVRIDFAEWTGGDKLRHTKFFAIREDKDARRVVQTTSSHAISSVPVVPNDQLRRFESFVRQKYPPVSCQSWDAVD